MQNTTAAYLTFRQKCLPWSPLAEQPSPHPSLKGQLQSFHVSATVTWQQTGKGLLEEPVLPGKEVGSHARRVPEADGSGPPCAEACAEQAEEALGTQGMRTRGLVWLHEEERWETRHRASPNAPGSRERQPGRHRLNCPQVPDLQPR